MTEIQAGGAAGGALGAAAITQAGAAGGGLGVAAISQAAGPGAAGKDSD